MTPIVVVAVVALVVQAFVIRHLMHLVSQLARASLVQASPVAASQVKVAAPPVSPWAKRRQKRNPQAEPDDDPAAKRAALEAQAVPIGL